MKISFHPEAESELLEAARFYQLRVAGLGLQFLEPVGLAEQKLR